MLQIDTTHFIEEASMASSRLGKSGGNMAPATRLGGRLVMVLAGLGAFGAGTAVWGAAVNSNWQNSTGVDNGFATGSNWDTTPNAPDADDTAMFGLNATYGVTFGAGVTTAGLQVSAGAVTFDLGNNTYEQSAGATISGSANPWLTIKNGTMQTDGSGIVGSKATVSTSGIWNLASIQVGHYTSGTLEIVNGGHVATTSSSYVTYGQINAPASVESRVTINGAGSLWDNAYPLYAGTYSNSQATIVISGGGELKTTSRTFLSSASNAGAGAEVTVTGKQSLTGAASTWRTNEVRLYTGSVLNVNDGGQVVKNTSATLNAYAGSTINMGGTGSIAINGAANFTDATLNVSHLGNALSLGGGAIFDSDSIFTITLAADGANASSAYLDLGTTALTLGDGGLDVLLDSGFMPSKGDSFHLLSWTGTLGSTLDGSTVHLPTLETGLAWDTSALGEGTVSVTSAPEPVGMVLLALGGLLLKRRRH
jgi:MYXO-CTERM domain-containing protein